MPSAQIVLDGVTALANAYWPLAIVWHGYFGVLIVSLLAGWRPSNRFAACCVTPPVLSVSVLAWRSGNPFNGAVFALLAMTLGVVAISLPGARVRIASALGFGAGALLLMFAWVYPHFLTEGEWSYVYAAPLGLIPCPTLAGAIGLTLVLNGLESKSWRTVLAGFGLVYGVVGALWLGVSLDYVLVAGSLALLVVRPESSTRVSARTLPFRRDAA